MTWQMSQKSFNDYSPSEEAKRKTRHHTDPIEFEILLKISEELVQLFDSYNTIASTVSKSGTTARSTTVRAQHMILQRPLEPATSSDWMVQLLENLNGSMAMNMDVLVRMSKENSQRHDEMTKSLDTMHTLLMNTWPKSETGKTNQSSQASARKCYYCCGIGHFIAECQFLAADMTEGKIETLDDGKNIEKKFPKEPSHLSPKDRVDRLWKD
jgi:hypothetical protein